ncbi:hypothetical protein KI387_038455, partial [Taxus chinensis]
RDLSHKTFTDPCEALEVAMCAEVVRSVDTGVSPFMEAQIAEMANQLEKLFTNSTHE